MPGGHGSKSLGPAIPGSTGRSYDQAILAHGELNLVSEVELVEPNLGDPNASGIADPDHPSADCLFVARAPQVITMYYHQEGVSIPGGLAGGLRPQRRNSSRSLAGSPPQAAQALSRRPQRNR